MSENKKNVVLVILDGWGIAPVWAGNAIALADTPTMDSIVKNYPYVTIEASGVAVGLPVNESGNSEVGHLNIGAGRIAKQGLTAINQMIENGSFINNQVINDSMQESVYNGKKLHLVGLLSDGGVHAHIKHLFALLDLAKKNGCHQVFIHAITDGRDCPPTSGLGFVKQLNQKLFEIGIGKIATISGRFYAMDRDKSWDRTRKAYVAMTSGVGKEVSDPESVLSDSYAEGITDEFLVPAVVDKSGLMSSGDSIVFFNYRSDRARQLIEAIGNKDFDGFERSQILTDLDLVSFSSCQEGVDLKIPFESREVSSPLASVLGGKNLSHLHVAETEKYAHVTYFFNGGREVPFANETRILLPSPDVETFDLLPEMSAKEITKKVLPTIGKYNFTVINFANADMVGHTGNLDATITAISCVDSCLKKIVDEILKNNYIGIITADHGNAEQMINPLTGLEDTEHTTNSVPCAIISNEKKLYSKLRENGKLCDLAPTILKIMGEERPEEMIGQVLFSCQKFNQSLWW